MAYTSPTIIASGTTFAQFQAAGATGHLERLIAANLAASGPPTAAPTVSATGGGTAGGSLAAGTYYLKVTESDGTGETTASPESAQFTVAAGNIPQVTFAALQAGNVSRNVYLTPANGASGTEVLYAKGITAGTYNLAVTTPSNSYAVPVPTVNTTGLISTNTATGTVGNTKLSNLRACEKGRLQNVWNNLRQLIGDFNRGAPVKFNEADAKLRDAHTVFAMMAQLCSEMGTLMDSNPGHFTTIATPIGGQKTVRQWP